MTFVEFVSSFTNILVHIVLLKLQVHNSNCKPSLIGTGRDEILNNPWIRIACGWIPSCGRETKSEQIPGIYEQFYIYNTM